MLVSYPALFYYDASDEKVAPYFVTFPDFEHSATVGDDRTHALVMASEWLGIHLADRIEEGEELPKPSLISELTLEANNPFLNDEEMDLVYDPRLSFISMVVVDVTDYLGS